LGAGAGWPPATTVAANTGLVEGLGRGAHGLGQRVDEALEVGWLGEGELGLDGEGEEPLVASFGTAARGGRTPVVRSDRGTTVGIGRCGPTATPDRG